MAGTINLSLSQQFDALGKPLGGGMLYFYAAGTTTPQNAYVDTALTIAYPNPITLDAAGRVPPFFLADGLIKIRLTDRFGVQQLAADNLVVVGPSSGGGGGGGTVDPTTILQTGFVVPMYGTGALSGFVRMNARTIGSVTSGASERANADTQSLFNYLWNADANLAVSGGRGASAAADWAANKNIALPDLRGRLLGGLDDMGNSPSGRITTALLGADPTVIGAAGGASSIILTEAQIPSHTHSGTTGTESASHGHLVPAPASKTTGAVVNSGGSTIFWTGDSGLTAASANQSFLHTHSFTTNGTGGGNAHPNLPPALLLTYYIKL